MEGDRGRWIGLACLVWLCASLAIGLQTWIGDSTIYSNKLEAQREALHQGILRNEAPGGRGWGAIGALTIQKRVAVVYLAEGLRKLSGLTVGKVYKLIDTVFLFVALLALFFYLRRWLASAPALIGFFYFAAMLPLSYPFQLFHPWDRLQLAMWIGLLYLALQARFWPLLLALPLSMTVKYDTIMLPLFYWLLHARGERFWRVGLEAALLGGLALATYVALGQLFPAPLDQTKFSPGGALVMLVENARTLAIMGPRFPPALVFTLPLALALLSWRQLGHELRASVIFALALLALFLAFSRFEEVRAQLVVLVLVLPAALAALPRLLGEPFSPAVRTAPTRPPTP